VSLLDFWLPGGAVELVVYAHSIDFGAKGYANLVELAAVQRRVAKELGLPVGRLVMVVKSAHVYEADLGYVRGVLAAPDPTGPPHAQMLGSGPGSRPCVRRSSRSR
jgi:thymidylate synthase